MPEYKIKLYGGRTNHPVRAEMTMKVQADNAEAANALVRDSLPGFDWKWESTWGVMQQAHPDLAEGLNAKAAALSFTTEVANG